MIRIASRGDVGAIASIYNHYVLNTIVTFEEQSVTDADMEARVRQVESDGLPWVVAESKGQVVGYAYASKWKPRFGYRFSTETTVYLHDAATGKGVGRELYTRLLEHLGALKIRAVIGGVALPNAASIALNESLGFEKVAHFREVGFKFDRWIDVAYWQRLL